MHNNQGKSEKMKFYSEHYLSKKSERFINKIWVLDNTLNDKPVNNKIILPNGCFNLAIITGNGLEVSTKTKCYKMKGGIYLSSQMTQKVDINIKSRTKVILIQLHAWSISYFPKYDLTNFLDEIIQIDSENLPFKYRIESSYFDNINKIIELTNKNFEELYDINPSKNLIELMCNEAELQNKKVSKKLESIKYSNRSLQIKFKKSTGLTRKQYSKLINLRKAVDCIAYPENETDNLTNIAFKNGYFDQTHFIKTFKDIIKITPKKIKIESFILSEKR